MNGLPFGAITSAPAFTQRLASGISEVMTISPLAGALRDPVIGGVHPGTGRDALDQRILRHPDEIARDHADRQPMPGGDAVDLVLDRAGIGVDIDAGGVQIGRHRLGIGRRTQAGALKIRVVPHRAGNCEENTGRNALATAFCSRTIIGERQPKYRETG